MSTDTAENKPNSQHNLMPFIFGRYTPESQLHANIGGQLVIKDWVVMIALPDFKMYDSKWMCDETLGDICCIPDVDICFESDYIFDSFQKARLFVGSWWVQRLLLEGDNHGN